MISSLRKHTKSWLFMLILGAIAISFVIVGNTDFLGGPSAGPVVKAGSREITAQRFVTDWNRIRDLQQERAGQALTTEEMVAQGALPLVLDQMVREEGFAAWAWKAGLRAGEGLVIDAIRELPAFFNQITGQFDEETYASALAQQNFTPQDFERGLRDQFALQHFGSAITGALRAPRVYSAVLANHALQSRDARWFFVTQAMAGTAGQPTDEQLNAFIQENADQLRRPEFRAVSLILFNDAPGAAAPAPTEAEIQERYEFRRDALSQPETRSFTTLSVADQAAAGRIAQALRAGQAVSQVAEANNVEPVTYADRAQASVSDTAVAAAAFGLQANGVSDPVRGNAGWTVIRLQAITPGQDATLDAVRGEIIAELQEEAARGRTYERVEAYEAARNSGAEVDAAVQQAGGRVVNLPPFTAEGQLPDGQPLNGPEQLVSTAYSLPEGGASDVIDAGQGQYFVVRLVGIEPAALPSLADVREPLTAQWIARENQRRLSATADRLAARARGDESIEAVAASVNAPVVVRTGIRQDQAAVEADGQGVIRAVFGQGRGQVFSAPAEQGFVIGRVDAVNAPAAAETGQAAARVLPQLTQQLAQDMGPAALNGAAGLVKARAWPERARAALGLPAETAPATK
ncbi:peptidyl-prolyl cis-trans isomerase [Brevundimonas lutea]|uniref:peptidyl-prolyl cis-trans isomerase n=1 Tax=Brevundimonas lutea TaxID=2293980 RepID=UPI000F029637|nr:peptidyl-prolyl cis-trans isomerase [Brevundimonas lutea]